MKKMICIVLAILMLGCMTAGCSRDRQEGGQQETEARQMETETQQQETEAAQKETEAPVVKTFELESVKITAENVSPYEGVYLEYGDKERVSGLYAMKFTNTGDQTIQNAQLIFSDGTQELEFRLEMLPAGHSVIVAEQKQLAVIAEQLQYVDGTAVYLEAGLEQADCAKVTGNQDGTVRIENVTEEMLPLVRVFFRSADESGNPIGGPCRSVMADGIEAGAAVTVEAEGWDDSCAVVTVLVINE